MSNERIRIRSIRLRPIAQRFHVTESKTMTHDPLCDEVDCQCDLIRQVRIDHRDRIVKTLRNLADHMTNGGLDDKTKEAWVLHWVSDLLEAK